LAKEVLSPKTVRRNIKLSVVNQFFVEGAMTLSDPSSVLALFVKALGGSNFLVGLMPSLRFFGWLAPQLFVAGRVQRFSRFIPVTRILEFTRASLYLAIAGFTLAYGLDNPQLTLSFFLVLFMITRFAAGSSAVARNEIIARMVPPRERSTVISLRRLSGGVAGFLAGFAVRYILDERVSSFPQNYALLIGISSVFFTVAILILSFVVEPQASVESKGVGAIEQLKRAPALLKGDRRYLLYVGMRAAATGLSLAAPFYMLYAVDVLGAPAAMAGVYISMRTFSRVLSNIFWGKRCKQRSSLWVLKGALLLAITCPVMVILISYLRSALWAGGAPSFLIWAFGLVFLMQGLANSAYGIGRIAYLYDIAPSQNRPTYYGLSNTILGPLYFLPALGGAILDRVGFAPLFTVAAIMLVLAYGLACKLGKLQVHEGCAPATIETKR